ncbi:MAG TPA: GIY-YIG nuclease family protein [Thermoanaerobaculia bacterium]|jgi:putative endonuclease|nr:GIY-YIG nuclease family protein [Thermoanaerobaculia bacterium]
MPAFYVYILASRSRALYVGVTNHLAYRVQQHKDGINSGFTHRYKINRLVYCETFGEVRPAIEREKQIKGWTRARKVALIESLNPEWDDLSAKL